jgi:hypothetical protein
MVNQPTITIKGFNELREQLRVAINAGLQGAANDSYAQAFGFDNAEAMLATLLLDAQRAAEREALVNRYGEDWVRDAEETAARTGLSLADVAQYKRQLETTNDSLRMLIDATQSAAEAVASAGRSIVDQIVTGADVLPLPNRHERRAAKYGKKKKALCSPDKSPKYWRRR